MSPSCSGVTSNGNVLHHLHLFLQLHSVLDWERTPSTGRQMSVQEVDIVCLLGPNPNKTQCGVHSTHITIFLNAKYSSRQTVTVRASGRCTTERSPRSDQPKP